MKPKEAFKGLCDLSRVDDEDFKMWVGLKGDVEQAITELEALKRDVKRYLELIELDYLITNEQEMEQLELHIKLLKEVNKHE